MKLVLNLATRGRPALLLETLKRTLDNITNQETVLMVSADDDDWPTVEAVQTVGLTQPMLSVQPREDTIGAKWNRALVIPADVYMPMVDHTVPLTPGFDQKIIDAAALFPDGIGAVHIHMANASFSAYNGITRKWADILGEIYPTYFPYWFVDHWTDDLARMIGRISFADVRTDFKGRPTTQEMREPGWWGTWFDAAHLMRRKQARMLIERMDESPATKQRLINNFPLTEWRSKLINESVRGQDRQLSSMSKLSLKDERYMRVKQRAIDMVPDMLAEYENADVAWFHPTPLQYRNHLTPPTSVPNLKRAFG